MIFPETRQERKWFSVGTLLAILAFALFLGKMGYFNYLNDEVTVVNNAVFESGR